MVSGDPQNTDRKKPKPSGKKVEKLSQKEQSERFKKAARDLGADETGIQFERAVDAIFERKGSEEKK